MKVAHCLSNLQLGGVPKQVVDQLPVVCDADRSIRHCLIAFKTGVMEETARKMAAENNIEFRVLQRARKLSLTFIRKLRQSVKAFDPDIVHCYNGTPAFWIRVLFWNRKKPFILCHYGGISSVGKFYLRWLERLLLLNTNQCIFNSRSTQLIYNNRLRIRCAQKVIYNGIRLPDAENVNVTMKMHDNGEPFRMLTVSRVTPIKSLDVCIRAVSELRKRNKDVKLIIVGDGSDLKRLRKLSADMGMSETVVFEGEQVDVDRYYRDAHMFAVVSFNETFCLSLCEAMYHRLVCISGNVGGPSEILEDGVNGFLIPMSEEVPEDELEKIQPLVWNGAEQALCRPRKIDYRLLADKINVIMERYGEMQAIRESAKKTVTDKYSAVRYAKEMVETYCEIVQGE